MLLVLLLSGCNRNSGRLNAGWLLARPGSRLNIKFRCENRDAYLVLRGRRFERHYSLRKPLRLNGNYVLEFLPLVEGAAQGARFFTYAEIDGRETLLSENEAVPVEELKQHPLRYLGAALVRIDLQRFRGHRLKLKWVMQSPAPGATAMLIGARVRVVPGRRPPDVLMICSDAHRFDYSLAGRGKKLMPGLQEFRQRATTYLKAYSTASWTLPSIASVYTGLWPRFHRAGERRGTVPKAEFTPKSVPEGEFPVEWPAKYQLLSAFAQSLPTILVSANAFYYLSGLAADGFSVSLTITSAPGDSVNRVVAGLIREQPASDPLFLAVHYLDVHEYVPRRGAAFAKRVVELPFAEQRKVRIAAYAEAVRDADRYLGKLFSIWRQARNPNQSLIVFFADHGEHLMDAHEITRRPLISHGNSMEDILLHVPLVICYPQRLGGAGKTVSRNVSLVDIAPTVFDVVGIAGGPGRLPGVSLWKADAIPAGRTLFADYQLFGDALGSGRRGPYKLVLNLDKKKTYLLKCTLQDCGLVKSGPGSGAPRKELEAGYWDYVRHAGRVAAKVHSRQQTDVEETLKRLRSLGYVR